jgi:flagellum-specific peptidoglycan hydrolase FlgJ
MINKNNWYWWAGGATLIGSAVVLASSNKASTAVDKIKEGAAKATEAVKTFINEAMNKKDFVKAYYPMAKEAEKVTGLNALVALTTAALESGWGKSAPFFNFFGHKKGSANVPYYESKTWEYGTTGDAQKDKIFDRIIRIYKPGEKVVEPGSRFDGKVMSNTKYAYRVYGKFRKYNNAREAFIAHGNFLKNNAKRYGDVFKTNDVKAQFQAMKDGGYATDPNYVDKNVKLANELQKLITA